uniref:Alkylated DNA repair protein AlkB homologue 8 N-terminal domain-containing protein n=1 Tax=Takifugu rubripes TaxID=31033 RepID=A0A674MI66_TAKRU
MKPTPATIVKCIPGARAGDIEANLKLLARSKCKFSKVIIYIGANDTWLCQLEVTKINIESVCNYAKTMLDSHAFSGPLPKLASDKMFSRMCELTGQGVQLVQWCKDNNHFLNIEKTKEMIIDFRRRPPQYPPLTINGAVVERESSTEFLGVHISEDLTWTTNTAQLARKAQTHLYFLCKLRRAYVPPPSFDLNSIS